MGINWGKTSTWFGGYGNDNKEPVIKVDKSKNARRYGSTSLSSIPKPKEQTWLSSLLDTTGVVKGDLYKGNSNKSGVTTPTEPTTPSATRVFDNYVYDGNGNNIMVNGVPYVDKFDSGAPKTPTAPSRAESVAKEGLHSLSVLGSDNGGLPSYAKAAGIGDKVADGSFQITADSSPEDDIDYIERLQKDIEALYGTRDAANSELSAYTDEILLGLEAQYSNAMAMLDAKYSNLKSMLDSEKSVSEQRAAISNAKLLKYLPEQLKSVGLYGVGTSQGAFLKAANMYQNQLSEAQRVYLKQLMEAENAYMSGATSASSSYNSAVMNALSNYRSEKQANDRYYDGLIAGKRNDIVDYQKDLEDKAYQKGLLEDERTYDKELYERELADKQRLLDQDAAYNSISAYLNSYGFETENDIDEYLKSKKGDVSDAQYKALEEDANLLKYYMKQNEQSEDDNIVISDKIEFNKNAIADWENDTFTVKVDGKKVKIDAEQIVYDDSQLIEATKELETDTVFGYNGAVYFKNKDGNIVLIREGGHEYDKVYGALYGKTK